MSRYTVLLILSMILGVFWAIRTTGWQPELLPLQVFGGAIAGVSIFLIVMLIEWLLDWM